MTAPTAARAVRVAPPAEPGPHLRKAALLLHAMPERDRAWLLGELPDAERKALGALLAELVKLGIPADRGLLDDALAAGEPPATARSSGGGAVNPLERVRAADAGRLAAILRDEPALLVARLLRVEDWPWHKALLAQLGSTARRQVEQALQEDRVAVAPALRAQLVEILAQRIAAADGGAGGAAERSWLRRWRGGRR